LLLESIPSVGGQVVLPPGYLPEVYRHVRAAGGVCMADEVQTGFGRIGAHWWAFQHYGVTPDVVALGKPIGNGYPIGAVITTPEIAACFDNGMEFFSTFGGSTVACTVGEAVLEVVQSENLLAQAHDVGTYLLTRLRTLMDRHAVVGDVRGLGLMLGLELVTDRTMRTPAPAQARYVADRLKDHGILLGTDGLDHNVLKIRGPMCLTRADADRLVVALDAVLAEEAAQATS
jgi:4-aminobutyrate aminotransferase-like enzyme